MRLERSGVVHPCARRNRGYAGRNHLVTPLAGSHPLSVTGLKLVTLFRNHLVTTS